MKRKRTNKSLNSSSSSSLLSSTKTFYLPNECWESICTFLLIDEDGDDNLCYLEHISLASKQFLSITNRLLFSLTIYDSPTPFISTTLFHRFPNITSLHLTRFSDDSLLCQISNFPLNLKSLTLSKQSIFPKKGLRALSKRITTLTSFTFSYDVVSLDDNHFVLISDCFPFLEELDLQCYRICYSNVGVNTMLTAFLKLRQIYLSSEIYVSSYNFGFQVIERNEEAFLLQLCKNCDFLEEVKMTCKNLTYDDIASAICQRPTLRSLSFAWSSRIHGNISSHFIDSLINLKDLTCLDLSRKRISDELLSSIAMEDLPLRRLVLQNCTGYSYAGIFSLLSKCQFIQHLDLHFAGFLNDQNVVNLSSFLFDLVSINLNNCWQLTDTTLFALVRNCPSISDIKMENTKVGENIDENSNSLNDFVLNPHLKSLYLAHCSSLTDKRLKIIASIIPNLLLLDLSYCKSISKKGICQVLRRCSKIRHLNLYNGNVGKRLRLKFEIPKLEVLNLSYTEVGDKTLYTISKSCHGLMQLLLECCKNVTKKGVMHVVVNCMQLREINLRRCDKVCANIVDEMVQSRPSLRKIFAPPCYSVQIMEFFWRHRCHIEL